MRIIETQRLLLRPFRTDDAKMMYQNWTYDERVARYCRWYPHQSISDTQALLEMYLEQAKKGFPYRWAITYKGDDIPIGVIDVVGVSEDGKRAEVGYVLSHAYWNRGIMSECLKAVIDFLFQAGFEEISANHHVDNPASGRVMEKCGMQFCGYEETQEKYGSDKLCKVKCYGIMKVEG